MSDEHELNAQPIPLSKLEDVAPPAEKGVLPLKLREFLDAMVMKTPRKPDIHIVDLAERRAARIQPSDVSAGLNPRPIVGDASAQVLTLPTRPIPGSTVTISCATREIVVKVPDVRADYDETLDKHFYTAWVMATTQSQESVNVLLCPGDTHRIHPGQPEITLDPMRIYAKDV